MEASDAVTVWNHLPDSLRCRLDADPEAILAGWLLAELRQIALRDYLPIFWSADPTKLTVHRLHPALIDHIVHSSKRAGSDSGGAVGPTRMGDNHIR